MMRASNNWKNRTPSTMSQGFIHLHYSGLRTSSIKTLAVEMSYALAEDDWKHLDKLLDRHWRLNQILDPHTANALINAILERARPWIHGAKLTGAGGGFLMLLARDEQAAEALRHELAQRTARGSVVEFQLATDGLRVQCEGGIAAGSGQPNPAGVAASRWSDSAAH